MMDLFQRRCSGTTLCHFATVIHRSCIGVLMHQNLVPIRLVEFRHYVPKAQVRIIHSLSWQQRYNSSSHHLPLSSFHCPNQTRCYHASISTSKGHHAMDARCYCGNLRRHQSSSCTTLLHLNNDFLSRRSVCSGRAKPASSDPALLVEDDMQKLVDSIKEALLSENDDVRNVADYYFDGGGKLLRPCVVLLMSKLCRSLTTNATSNVHVLPSQYKIAVVSEMIHTASLIHDDVIDDADMRRSRPTANRIWGNKKAILAGDYILAKATKLLASIGNPEVISLLAQVIEDLVKGEFMQLSNGHVDYQDRFSSYLSKTFMKTASLFANSCRAVALLSNSNDVIQDMAYEYGRNVGMAFQLIDDTLDFVGDAIILGKPAVADLRLGISTAPVLFAADQFPELNELMERRFKQPGDVQKAWDIVLKSNGIESTRKLANEHCATAIQILQSGPPNNIKDGLIEMATLMTHRTR